MNASPACAQRACRIRRFLGAFLLASGGLILLNHAAAFLMPAETLSPESRYEQHSSPEQESSSPFEADLA